MNNANPFLRSVAQSYNETYSLPLLVEGQCIPLDIETSKVIASAYDALPVLDLSLETVVAYMHFAIEIRQQYLFARQYIDIEVWHYDGQPYNSSSEMCADVRENYHLYVFGGGEVHPLLGREENGVSLNVQFRAIHDLFGHAKEGYSFGPKGEENAWNAHKSMFSALALPAMTSETRGQNSWFNFGPYSALPVSERPFAEQKVALLPVAYS